MNILAGPLLFIKSLLLILSSRQLILRSLVPGLVSFFSTVILFFGIQDSLPHLRTWFSWFDQIAGLFSYFDLFFSVILTFLFAPFMIMLIALPLCEPLAAEVDRQYGGEEVELSFWEGVVSGISLSLKLIVIGLSVSCILSILSLLPIIGMFTGLFNLLVWTPFILSMDITDFVFSRRAKSLSDRLATLLKSPLSTLSVGLVALPLLSTPFLNLLGAPLAVIMGTLYARQLESDTSS